MANIAIFKAELTGWSGAPGVTLFIAKPTDPLGIIDTGACETFAGLIASCYTSIRAYLRSAVSMNINPEVKIYNEATGVAVDVKQITPPATVTGSGSATTSTLPLATMANVALYTDSTVNGRLVRGRHFHGPLAGAGMDSDGTTHNALKAAIPNAYGGMLDIAGFFNLAVWTRPKDGAGGQASVVKSVICRDAPGLLKGRAS